MDTARVVALAPGTTPAFVAGETGITESVRRLTTESATMVSLAPKYERATATEMPPNDMKETAAARRNAMLGARRRATGCNASLTSGCRAGRTSGRTSGRLSGNGSARTIEATLTADTGSAAMARRAEASSASSASQSLHSAT